jgi:hypothetical protein
MISFTIQSKVILFVYTNKITIYFLAIAYFVIFTVWQTPI